MRVLKGLRDVNAVVNHLGENTDFVIGGRAGRVCPTLGGSRRRIGTHRVIKGCHRRGCRRCAGEEVVIKFAACLTEASHVGMNGWKAGKGFSKDLMKRR